MPCFSVFERRGCNRRVTQGGFSIAFLCTLVATLLLVGCENPGKLGRAAGPVEVAVVEIKTADVPVSTELPGRTSAYRIAQVRPQVGGVIAKRLFVEGSQVNAGDPLYQIASEMFLAEVNRAAAAQLRAEALMKAAQLRVERFAGLVGQKMISEQDYDDAQAALGEARASVEVARAEKEIASINLRYSLIKAPISGRIGRSFVTDGALVGAEQEEVLAIIRQVDPLYVDITQSSRDMLAVKRQLSSGQLELLGVDRAVVRLILEDGSEYVHPGSLKFSEVSVDETTGAVTLRATVPNPDALLLPGMFVRARLEQGIRKSAILVPQQAISFDYSGNAVALVVGADNKVERRLITTGQAFADQWLVLEGLQPGEHIISEGLQKVRHGVEVKTVISKLSAGKVAGNKEAR